MKRNLLIALLLIPFWGLSQTTKPIEGFLGVKFGASKAEVLAAVKAKGGTSQKSDDVNQLIFDNIKLSGRAAEYLIVLFVDNKAYEAQFFFKAELEAQTIEYYNNLVNDFAGVYGAGVPTKKFKEPYTDGDGFEVQAIGLGKANYFTDWKSGDNSIQIDIGTNLNITLFYTDGKLEKIVQDKKKEKQKSDM